VVAGTASFEPRAASCEKTAGVGVVSFGCELYHLLTAAQALKGRHISARR
jgi:hypothetical protein